MPIPNPICKVANEVPTEKLLCCSENNCRVNEVSLTCGSHEYLTNCHNIGDLETCQQTEKGVGPVCQHKNDKNKLLCLWAEKEPFHPDGRALSERNFTEGPHALIHQRQRAWMIDRRKLEESNMGSAWTCCSAEKCSCCFSDDGGLTNTADCSSLPQRSTAIWCHALFNPILNIDARRHCAFGGVGGNDTAVGFFLNYSGQVCDKRERSPVFTTILGSPIPTSSENSLSDKLSVGDISGITIGVLSLVVAAIGTFFAYKDYKKRRRRSRANETENIGLSDMGNSEISNKED